MIATKNLYSIYCRECAKAGKTQAYRTYRAFTGMFYREKKKIDKHKSIEELLQFLLNRKSYIDMEKRLYIYNDLCMKYNYIDGICKDKEQLKLRMTHYLKKYRLKVSDMNRDIDKMREFFIDMINEKMSKNVIDNEYSEYVYKKKINKKTINKYNKLKYSYENDIYILESFDTFSKFFLKPIKITIYINDELTKWNCEEQEISESDIVELIEMCYQSNTELTKKIINKE